MNDTCLRVLAALAISACSTVTVRPPPAEQVEEAPEEWSFEGDDAKGAPVTRPVDLLIQPDGTTLLAGDTPNGACGLERIAADGTYLGMSEYATSATGNRIAGTDAIALAPNGEILLLCLGVDDSINVATAWVGWLDSSGALLAQAELPEIDGFDIIPAEDPNEAIIVGVNEVTGRGTFARMAKTGPTGEGFTIGNEANDAGVTPRLAHHPDGWIAMLHAEPGSSEGIVREYNLLRVEAVGPTVLEPACGAQLAVAPDGAVYTATDYLSGKDAYVCRHTESGGAWTTEKWPVSIAGSVAVTIHDIDADPDGGVVVTGTVVVDDSGRQEMFARGYSSSGDALWADGFAAPGKLESAWGYAIAASPDRVVYAGVRSDKLPGTVVRSLTP